jgi:hypothetical protein
LFFEVVVDNGFLEGSIVVLDGNYIGGASFREGGALKLLDLLQQEFLKIIKLLNV